MAKKIRNIALVLLVLVFALVGYINKNDPEYQLQKSAEAEAKAEAAEVKRIREEGDQKVREGLVKYFKSDQEPKALDAMWSNSAFLVGVLDDGTVRDGFAEYVCQHLHEFFDEPGYHVEVIDITKLANTEKFVMLGESRCKKAVAKLPPHQLISDTTLAPKDGSRIEIHVENPDLTKDECKRIINAYRENAGPEGQVSIRKPSLKLENSLNPWCVDNMDGKGIVFNDDFF